jgi:hypothetical protein
LHHNIDPWLHARYHRSPFKVIHALMALIHGKSCNATCDMTCCCCNLPLLMTRLVFKELKKHR